MEINGQKVECKFKFKDDTNTPATAVLIIGEIKVKGFRVCLSKFKDNKLQHVFYPPAAPVGPGWYKLFWTKKETWTALEEFVLQEFREQHTIHVVKETFKD